MKSKNPATGSNPLSFLKELGDNVNKIKSSDKGTSMFKIGESTGSDLFNHFVRSVRGNEKKLIKVLEILNLTDYGKFEFKAISEKSIIVIVRESPLTEICSGNSKNPHWICIWVSGLLYGMFKNINTKWKFQRSSCDKSGSRCEFRGNVLEES
ncbi:MAG: hypothetical protein V1678_00270 [Candidatus Aenigmatarchaeota archaeon]